jgi:hypothetical protein
MEAIAILARLEILPVNNNVSFVIHIMEESLYLLNLSFVTLE